MTRLYDTRDIDFRARSISQPRRAAEELDISPFAAMLFCRLFDAIVHFDIIYLSHAACELLFSFRYPHLGSHDFTTI